LSRILITGGAGFIGSSLADELMRYNNQVMIYDNFSRGTKLNISNWNHDSNFKVIEADILDKFSLSKAVDSCDIVFHLAANPEVRLGSSDTKIDYEQNVLGTYNLLEVLRNSPKCKRIVFASTSTVYGEPDIIPTPEKYSPLKPISLYGASKLACEALVSGYCYMFNITGVALRLANIIGPRSTHGVIWDFINKLLDDPVKLDILGDGTQNKSYLFIDDCVRALETAAMLIEKKEHNFDIFNVGSIDRVDVMTIAKIIIEELCLDNVKLNVMGGHEGRGWKGDVKDMLLNCSKLQSFGWKPQYTSAQAVSLTTRGIMLQQRKVLQTTV
jgi:UDP-glucose 4-epimerase